jgi:hypothetical protein
MHAPQGPAYSNQRSVNGDQSKLNGPGLTEPVCNYCNNCNIRGLPMGPVSNAREEFTTESSADSR